MRDATPEQRKAVYERDNYSCCDCGHKGIPGKTKIDIQCHHIKPMFIEVINTLENLITLCVPCHRKRHSKGWQDLALKTVERELKEKS